MKTGCFKDGVLARGVRRTFTVILIHHQRLLDSSFLRRRHERLRGRMRKRTFLADFSLRVAEFASCFEGFVRIAGQSVQDYGGG